MVILGQNKRKVQYRAGCCLNDLIKAVEKKFSNVLAENNQRVFLLQQWNNDYKEYEDICDEQPDIPDKSKIMVSQLVSFTQGTFKGGEGGDILATFAFDHDRSSLHLAYS